MNGKAHLLQEVRFLAEKLKRPVSSRDLAAHWRAFPDSRPLLLQAPGQLLIKASRECETGERVHRIGLYGNLAFYAPDEDSFWQRAFDLYTIRERMRRHVRWGIPQHALYLVGTDQERYGLNAIAGFLEEWGPVMEINEAQQIAIETGFIKMMDLARSETVPPWAGRIPKLTNRAKVARIILCAVADTRDGDSKHFNVNRHLAEVAWPQTPVFTEKGYWLAQVAAYVDWKWPPDDFDPFEARALYFSMYYGVPAV